MNISANISSIQSHQTMMNVNANNVANVNTDGFVPNSTVLKDTSDGVSASVREGVDNGSTKSQTDLTTEIPQQISIENGVSANVSAIRTQDEMLGSLLDIKS